MFLSKIKYFLKLNGMDDFSKEQQVKCGLGFISKKNKKICPI